MTPTRVGLLRGSLVFASARLLSTAYPFNTMEIDEALPSCRIVHNSVLDENAQPLTRPYAESA
jgi:hypothetical protein